VHLHWRICVFHTCLPSCTRVLKRANQYDKVRCSFGVILNSLLAEKCKALQQHRSNARLREGILKTEGTMRLSRTLGAGRARFSTDTPHKTCTESGESNNSTIIHPRTATNRYIYIFCRLLGSRGLVSRCSSWKNETHNTTHIRVGGGQAEACHLAAAPRWWWWSLTVLCRSCRACAAGAEPVYRRTGMRDYCRGWVTVVIAWRHRSLFLNQSFGSSLSCRPSTCASVVCSPSKFRSRLILY